MYDLLLPSDLKTTNTCKTFAFEVDEVEFQYHKPYHGIYRGLTRICVLELSILFNRKEMNLNR